MLDYTYRRPLKFQSFFTQPGGDRHDADSYARTCAEIEEKCRVVKEGLSSSWLVLPQLLGRADWQQVLRQRCASSGEGAYVLDASWRGLPCFFEESRGEQMEIDK